MTVDPAVLEELDRLRARVPELSGSVLATTDGLVVAHDAHGIEPDGLAALAAARRCVRRLVRILSVEAKPHVRPEIPTQAGPAAPLARRTPMATLPNNARRRQATG